MTEVRSDKSHVHTGCEHTFQHIYAILYTNNMHYSGIKLDEDVK